jgi:FemAB-related protein (PEP-CTERM system-associated)
LYDGDASEWDSFVRSSSGWTHFHLYGWRTVIERAFGHECVYLAARDENGLTAVLPLVRVKSLLFGHYLVSLPFVNYGGPLGKSAAVRLLVDRAKELASAQGVELLELRSREDLGLDLPASHRKITVLLDLPSGDIDPLWRKLPTDLRTKIRRPAKEGVDVRFGADQLPPFYDVFSRHMRDLGTPVQSRRFFETVAEVFPQDVRFVSAYLNGRPIAVGCGLRWGQEFEITWGSALTEFDRLRPNTLLYWKLMEACVAEGVTLFNFGRCTPDGGTHRFKRQWGSRDEKLWWYHRAAGERVGTPSPQDKAFSWGPWVWKRLPLFVANSVGPRVVRNVP